MNDSLPQFFIAIDGGGTSCRFAMQTPDGCVTLEKGSANVFTAPEAAMATITDGLNELAALARIDPAQLKAIPVYAGLAGVADRATAAYVAQNLPARHVQVEDDRRAAIAGALKARKGCVVGIGTGSFLARQTGGDVRMIGGYGTELGDEASGCWLGMGLLRRALHVLDGITASSALVDDCLARFHGDAAEIVAFSRNAQPVDYGAFAPQIVAAASEGDVAGRDLMVAGAAYICDGLRALGRVQGEPVCLVGGVAIHYAGYLAVDIAADIALAQGTSLDGALELARRLALQAGQEMA